MEHKKYAFVLTMFGGIKYLPGLLCCSAMLKKQIVESKRNDIDIVAQVTLDSYQHAHKIIGLFCNVIKVVPYIDNHIVVDKYKVQTHPGYQYVFTKLWSLTYEEYEKVILVHIDFIPLKNFVDLFELNTPAGALERPYNISKKFPQYDWDDLYSTCCNTNKKIPSLLLPFLMDFKTQTKDFKNGLKFGGLNASLFVLSPSKKEFLSIMNDIVKYDNKPTFRFPEQQYLTIRWAFGNTYDDPYINHEKNIINQFIKTDTNKKIFCDNLRYCDDKIKKSIHKSFDYYNNLKMFSKSYGPWHGIHPIYYTSDYDKYDDPYGISIFSVKKPWDFNEPELEKIFIDKEIFGLETWTSYYYTILNNIIDALKDVCSDEQLNVFETQINIYKKIYEKKFIKKIEYNFTEILNDNYVSDHVDINEYSKFDIIRTNKKISGGYSYYDKYIKYKNKYMKLKSLNSHYMA